MEIIQERNGDVLILRLVGKLDASTSKDLETKMLAVIAERNLKLVIDLSRLDYISSAGLRVFLVAAKRMEGGEGKMVLCALTEAVKHVFDIAGFSTFLVLEASSEDAIKNIMR